ncbi:EAL domain-containing protein [Accumulibacter sp.]|uniref:putative bifunctional diguanylate cyclase/phosphodiesterase n=1 Tax=Accumulibacter sp. TaxID=2053492 RepID=UPI002B611D03|nr:EAL domain-containing protein [Accumulibacter sp.]HPU80200.1 EAL domain-containing protein [Accumulibacter sp.]
MEHPSTESQGRTRFALKRYFSLSSLLCTVLTAIVLGWSYQHLALGDLKNLAEGRNIALTNALANALWPNFSPLVDDSAGATADALRARAQDTHLQDLVAQQMKGTDVVKVKVYALNGMTVFSTDPGQTGEDKSSNAGFLAAREGRVASVLSHRDTMDTFEGTVTDLDVISSYLPVRNESKAIVGVIEIYSDVTTFVVRLEETRRIVIGIVFGLLALLYGLLFLLVARAQGIIDRQSSELEASLNAVELANRELDRRVQERTQALNETNRNLIKEIDVRRAAEKQLKLAAEVFDNAKEGIMITDADQQILAVNDAFTRMTGYSADEAVGQTPRLLNSGRQDSAFYATIWAALTSEMHWQGEIWNRRKNGEVFPEWLSIAAVRDEEASVSHYVAVFSDLTQRKAAERKIDHLAFYDILTDLPNRRLLLDRLQHALTASSRTGRGGALLFVDLDNFKSLNDIVGRDQGDLVLQQVAQRLAGCVRASDTVSRPGSDEFVVMLEDLSESAQEAATQAEMVGEKILAALSQVYPLASYAHHSTVSIGIALFGDRQESVDDLLQRAESAMHHAKGAGRNTLRFFDPSMQAVITARAALEAGLREAVQREQFLVYYQAQVDSSGRVTGAEALLRWLHPERGLVSPAEFIPLVEETRLILPIGQWVLDTACERLAAWADQPALAHLTIAVNVSARQFHDEGFVDQVLAALARSGARPQRLKLELTESLLVDDVDQVIAKMSVLKAKGVDFSLDDFGTGYSSLSYLKRLPLDQLKIDQSFIRNILTDTNDAAIARMVVVLAESLGLAVIAEGVETEAQRDFLASQGCHAYQGYLFSRPLPVEGFEAFAQRA